MLCLLLKTGCHFLTTTARLQPKPLHAIPPPQKTKTYGTQKPKRNHKAKMTLTDFSPSSVIPAIEQNNIDLFISASVIGNKTRVKEEDISWVIGKPFWPNYLIEPNFDIESINLRLQYLGKQMEERILPPVIKFGPKGKPSDLPYHLKKNDFIDMQHNPPGMAMDLDHLKPELFKTENLSIRQVDSPGLIKIWVSQFSMFELEMFEKLIEEHQYRFYIGFLDDKPIAVSMSFFSSGVVGIYQVQVDPEFRRRGFGAAITIAPLLEAKRMDYKIAVLQASKMGEGVYRKIGFKEFFRYEYYHRKDCTFRDFITA